MNNILNSIAEKRNKQIQNGEYLPKDRYEFNDKMIANLAAFYASKNDLYCLSIDQNHSDIELSKKSQLVRKEQLITAGALIVAELQRLEHLNSDLYCFIKYL
ncbi:MAG: hypothetical protein PHO27_02475 [Sulfuricurvum sp.]|nr:hypothetical protein [Sulfuricurvum sp.]